MLLRGLIRCKNCGGTVTGDIKKQKYVYYSCHNAKRMCTKKWVKEEVLLDTILENFDHLQLTDEKISELVAHINEQEALEYATAQQTQQQLTQRLNLAQERISKLIDMHVDGRIDAHSYHFKLDEYKREQKSILDELNGYKTDKQVEAVAAQDILELARTARNLFMSSKLDEKQQLLGFFCSNLQLNHEKLDVELKIPFNMLAKVQDQHIWRPLRDSFLNRDVTFGFSLQHIKTVCSTFSINVAA